MIPDPIERTVVLPVRVRDGRVEFFYGGPLPALEEDTIGDLVVPAFSLKNQALLGPLSNHLDVPILPAGTRLMAGLRPDRHLREISPQFRSDRFPQDFTAFAEITLKQSLELRSRGTKRAALNPCMCHIPVLNVADKSDDGLAKSVNHAYTRLSERFETYRRSHTGNVFQAVFFRDVDPDRGRSWAPLEILRRRIEAKIEQRFRSLAGANQ